MANYRLTFDHYTLLENIRFYFKRIIGMARWRIFQRQELVNRYNDQWHEIQEINFYFKQGWRLYGNGETPWLNYQFSNAFANTVFMFVDREDEARTSYCYRISNNEVNNELGIYCQTTNESFQLNSSDKEDLDVYLIIAAASVGLLVDGNKSTSERNQEIYDGIVNACFTQDKQ